PWQGKHHSGAAGSFARLEMGARGCPAGPGRRTATAVRPSSSPRRLSRLRRRALTAPGGVAVKNVEADEPVNCEPLLYYSVVDPGALEGSQPRRQTWTYLK